MNYVERDASSSRTDTRKTLLGNDLVLVAAQGSGIKIELKEGADLAGALAGGKLAVGDVKAVPAGKYAKAALEKLGLWASVEGSLAQTENVRAALALRRPRRSHARHRLWRPTPRPSPRSKSPELFPTTRIRPSSILSR